MAPPMNSAEYRTLHDALGMSTAKLAELSGTTPRMVWHWESADRDAPVPDEAAAAIMGLSLAAERVASGLLIDVLDGRAESVARYRTAEQFDAAYPALAGWGLAAQGLLLARVIDELDRKGLRVVIEWADA